MNREPRITVNNTPLATSQAMAVRVALGIFLMDKEYLAALGETGKLYEARLGEVLKLMVLR